MNNKTEIIIELGSADVLVMGCRPGGCEFVYGPSQPN